MVVAVGSLCSHAVVLAELARAEVDDAVMAVDWAEWSGGYPGRLNSIVCAVFLTIACSQTLTVLLAPRNTSDRVSQLLCVSVNLNAFMSYVARRSFVTPVYLVHGRPQLFLRYLCWWNTMPNMIVLCGRVEKPKVRETCRLLVFSHIMMISGWLGSVVAPVWEQSVWFFVSMWAFELIMFGIMHLYLAPTWSDQHTETTTRIGVLRSKLQALSPRESGGASMVHGDAIEALASVATAHLNLTGATHSLQRRYFAMSIFVTWHMFPAIWCICRTQYFDRRHEEIMWFLVDITAKALCTIVLMSSNNLSDMLRARMRAEVSVLFRVAVALRRCRCCTLRVALRVALPCQPPAPLPLPLPLSLPLPLPLSCSRSRPLMPPSSIPSRRKSTSAPRRPGRRSRSSCLTCSTSSATP